MKRFLFRLHAIALLFVFSAVFSVSPLGTVRAWIQQDAGIAGTSSDRSSYISYWNECGIHTTTNGIWAEAGDVVSADKWNNYICRIGNVLWGSLFDWARGWTLWLYQGGQTNFLWRKNNVIDGKGGGFVGAVNLGVTQEGEGQVRFHAPENGYEFSDGINNTTGWYVRLGTMRYMFGRDGLDFNGFRGGLWISRSPSPDASVDGTEFSDGIPSSSPQKSYVIGWEKMNIYGTESFDLNCSYRTWMDGGDPRMWYPEVVRPDKLRTVSGLSWSSLPASNKTQWQWDFSENGHMAGPAPNGQVVKLERLCLWPTSRTGPPKLTYGQNGQETAITYTVPSGQGQAVTHEWNATDATNVTVQYKYSYGTCADMTPASSYETVTSGGPNGSQTLNASSASVDNRRGCTYSFRATATGGAGGTYVAYFDQTWQ